MSRKQQGFTLLELIVAIAVFAIMATMAHSGLSSVLNTREQAEQQAERLAQLQKAFLIIGRDIEQAVNRTIRDNYANEVDPLVGGGYGTSVLELSRTGRNNPMQLQRSHLQRVAYMLSEEELIRQSWQVVDRSLDTEPYESVLMENVQSIELRFMDAEKQWQQQWPSFAADPDAEPTLPRAVEVKLELEGWGEVVRIFEVVG